MSKRSPLVARRRFLKGAAIAGAAALAPAVAANAQTTAQPKDPRMAAELTAASCG
jgi:hypothetical protein